MPGGGEIPQLILMSYQKVTATLSCTHTPHTDEQVIYIYIIILYIILYNSLKCTTKHLYFVLWDKKLKKCFVNVNSIVN